MKVSGLAEVLTGVGRGSHAHPSWSGGVLGLHTPQTGRPDAWRVPPSATSAPGWPCPLLHAPPQVTQTGPSLTPGGW